VENLKDTIKIVVPGIPKSQKRHRFGRGFTYDPSKQDKTTFLSLVREQAPEHPILGPIALKVRFTMPRPKKHFKSGKHFNSLKHDAPYYHTYRPDTDNLLKFVMDALGREIFFKDDSQVSQIKAMKVYGDYPRTEILIGEIKYGEQSDRISTEGLQQEQSEHTKED